MHVPEFADLIGSVEEALAAFSQQPERVNALLGRFLDHRADRAAAAPSTLVAA